MKTLRLTSLLLILSSVILCGLALRHYGPANFDEFLLLWFRVSGDISQLDGPPWISRFWSWISWTGNITPRISVAFATILGLLVLRRWHSALFIFAVLLSGVVLTVLLKYAIARPRPQLVTHLDYVSSMSYPSGHTLNSTLFYITLAWVISPMLPTKILRWSLFTIAITLSLAIGISRVALGVHWPTDVIASWVIATAWLSLCVLIVKHYWPGNRV